MQKRIIHFIAAHKAATGEADRRTSKSPLKIHNLRFALYGADDSRRSPEA